MEEEESFGENKCVLFVQSNSKSFIACISETVNDFLLNLLEKKDHKIPYTVIKKKRTLAYLVNLRYPDILKSAPYSVWRCFFLFFYNPSLLSNIQ